jgi:hypothetical protein
MKNVTGPGSHGDHRGADPWIGRAVRERTRSSRGTQRGKSRRDQPPDFSADVQLSMTVIGEEPMSVLSGTAIGMRNR